MTGRRIFKGTNFTTSNLNISFQQGIIRVMNKELESLKQRAEHAVEQVQSLQELEGVFREFVGRNGEIRKHLLELKNLAQDERKEAGAFLVQLREEISEKIEEAQERIKLSDTDETERVNALFAKPITRKTSLKKSDAQGAIHPLTQVENTIQTIFSNMGFDVVQGNHIETDEYNFEKLNIPKDHPARDMWDTLWINPQQQGKLLRTHTSPLQVRYMEKHQPPFRVIAPGVVFRNEKPDPTHHYQFHQVEGLVVDDKGKVSVANFKAVINKFFSAFFEQNVNIRLRPGYFPFVEPGFEVDMSCVNCAGKGCKSCKNTGWLEMAGAGMVHPKVFQNAGYNPDKVSGFAFGLGLDRVAMMKYGVDDVREFLKNDIYFLQKFI